MNMPLPAALAELDPKNDAHWTTEGLPAMAVVNEKTGGKFTRKDLPAELTRETAPEPKAFFADANATDEDMENQSILAAASTMEDEADAEGQEVSEEQGREEEVDVLSDDEILEADLNDMGNSKEMMEQWMAAADRKQISLHRAREELNKEIDMWARRADLVNRILTRVRRANPDQDNTSIQAFLKRQAQAREEKAKRAQAFIAAGTTAQDVAAQIGMKAPIDTALNQRKAKPGSTRPARGLPVRK